MGFLLLALPAMLIGIGIQVFWNGAIELPSSIGTTQPPSDL